MKPFTFLSPERTDDACVALAEYGPDATPLAGGQTLLLNLKPRISSHRVLIHIGRLPALREWRHVDGSLQLGAATPYSAIEDASELPGGHDMLREVAGNLADRAVRNLGTVGGAVNAALPAFDFPAALLALDARLVLRTVDRHREMSVHEFLRGEETTAREPDELMETIVVPPRDDWRWAFEKARHRIVDSATASVAVAARLNDATTLDEVRFVVGAVSNRPWRLDAVESALIGRQLDTPTIDAAATLAGDGVTDLLRPSLSCSPAYAQHLVSALTRRALKRINHDSEREAR